MSTGGRWPRAVANGPILCFRLWCRLATARSNYQPSAALVSVSSTPAFFSASVDGRCANAARSSTYSAHTAIGAHPYDYTDLRLPRLTVIALNVFTACNTFDCCTSSGGVCASFAFTDSDIFLWLFRCERYLSQSSPYRSVERAISHNIATPQHLKQTARISVSPNRLRVTAMRAELAQRGTQHPSGSESIAGNTDLPSSDMSSSGVEKLLMENKRTSCDDGPPDSSVTKRNLSTGRNESAMNGNRQNALSDDAVEPRVCCVSHYDDAKSSLSVIERCCSSVCSFYALFIRAVDLIWSYVPPKLYLYCCYLTYLFWFCMGILVLRKTQNAIAAVRYVKIHGPDVSEAMIAASPQFKQLLWTLDHEFQRPPAIFFLNQYALNMTFNFLCNTRDLEGVHDRLIFITLDSTARDVLKEHWPLVRQVYWPTPSLYRPFSFAEGAYQTLYLLRANLAVCLLRNGKSFWMMQQDTFWRKNLFDLKLENNYEYDALFDQIGDDQNSERAEWVNGANFFVHANNDTLRFFEAVARKLAHWYTPDMGIMIHQCHTWGKPKCSYIPHKIAHSWEWMYTDQKNPPYIMQLDCETDGGSKLMQLARFGFYFVNSNDRRTCNQTAVDVARSRMEAGQIEAPRARLSWGRFQFKVYWWIVDYMLWTPVIGPLMKPYLPLIGFCIMITI